MSSRAYRAAVGIAAGLVSIFAGFVSLVVLAYVELRTVPGLIQHFVFQGDPSSGLGLGFLVVMAPLFLIPLDIGIAMLLGFGVYIALSRGAPKAAAAREISKPVDHGAP